MSAVSAAFARVIAALGGPQTAVIVLVAGIVAGGLGGYAVATAQPGSQTGSTGVPVYPCPNQGRALLTVAGGQQLLVTGRLADNSWLRIHLPEPGRSEGWVQAGPLTVNGSVDALPVVACAGEAGAPPPAIAPVESLTAIVNATPSPGPSAVASPSSSPSSPSTPSPSPTQNVGPTLANLAASTRSISYDQGSYCPKAIKSVTISVKASDASGVASVTLVWRPPGASAYTQSAMSLTSGSQASGSWKATLGTAANSITQAGTLVFYVVAADSAGATSRLPSSGFPIAVAVCANTGPTITSVASSAGSTLSWDPLGVGTCQTATNITAAVADVDGVKAVTLFFRRPGSSSWSSKSMDNQTVPGRWFANLDTLGDKITIPTPPTGTLSWYIKAVDGHNLATQTKVASITIRRCDSEAVFDGVAPTSRTYSCGSAQIQITTYANDRDQPENGLKVVFYWTLTNTRTQASTSGRMAANLSKGNQYWGTTSTFVGKTFYYGVLTAYVVTTDKYGGTTTSQAYTTTNLACQ